MYGVKLHHLETCTTRMFIFEEEIDLVELLENGLWDDIDELLKDIDKVEVDELEPGIHCVWYELTD